MTHRVCTRFHVDGDVEAAVALLPHLEDNLAAWRKSHWVEEFGCFFQRDTWDGEEASISGDGCRPILNSAMVRAMPSSCTVHDRLIVRFGMLRAVGVLSPVPACGNTRGMRVQGLLLTCLHTTRMRYQEV